QFSKGFGTTIGLSHDPQFVADQRVADFVHGHGVGLLTQKKRFSDSLRILQGSVRKCHEYLYRMSGSLITRGGSAEKTPRQGREKGKVAGEDFDLGPALG